MDEDKIEELSLKYIDKYFNENTLVDHQLESCNTFYQQDIRNIFRDLNPIKYNTNLDTDEEEDIYKMNIYIGGKNADKIYFNSPMIIENKEKRNLFPNECRLKNITYATTIYYEIEVECMIYNKSLSKYVTIKKTFPENNKYELGAFPIMLKSDLCILNKLNKELCYQLGECRHDYGGYFIIDGKEKVIVPQEKFGDNLIYMRRLKDNKHDFSVEIRSISEDHSKPKRTMSIRRDLEKGAFLVDIPNVRMPIPLFIVIRALGIISDKDICKVILSDLTKNESYLELLRPSINDAGNFYTQLACLEYISCFLKLENINESHNILTNYLLPHIGEMNYSSKALYIGYMVFELLKSSKGEQSLTDRDHYKFKRVETTGALLKKLFTEYAVIMYKEIRVVIEKEVYFHKDLYEDVDRDDPKFDPKNSNMLHIFKDHIFNEPYIATGFKRAFKGDWGAHAHTKQLGVLQDLNRLSYNSFLAHLRKINIEMESSSKIVGPHLLHGSQFGYLDPVDTPDGGEVGLHKYMTIMCKISKAISYISIYHFLVQYFTVYPLEECTYETISQKFRLFINGRWMGMVEMSDEKDPMKFKTDFLKYRRLGILDSSISISIQLKERYVFIYSDEGRLIRPLMYFVDEKLMAPPGDFTWSRLVQGGKPQTEFVVPDDMDAKHSKYLEYIDSSEIDMCYIAMTYAKSSKQHTHLEIHPSLMFGVMGNQIIFPENNQLPRNLFGCGQAKQAVSLYHSNFIHRIDKMGVVLNYGQKPIVRTRYFNYIHEEQHPYGENVIVAIMSHSGYNVEDAILINESSLKRGLFKTSYYNMYETIDEITIAGKSEKRIDRVLNYDLARDTKPGYNYNLLDENGLIAENTIMDDKTVVIGQVNIINGVVYDSSVLPKKGQLGIVDKTFIYDKDGLKMAKVRIREERVPTIGDKFCSRCGQKGTVGNVIPEENMPFTKSGLKPDIIVNPHALPSRMTIGQLIETILAKLCCANGMSADSTAFLNKGPKHQQIGEHLNTLGYHSEGNEILYNGMTGEQITSEIFMGPTYYMRLKHMVKDKINYRATGPRDLLTRQTNHGRANDGGLRIGEMERDGVISHGMTSFLKDSMMKRGDEYKMAICNHSGSIAIYHKQRNYFYSLLADGPIEYTLTEETAKPTLITKYGKEFSIVNIPYSFKLLMHELTAMNVHMRLITSDNINHLSNIRLKKGTEPIVEASETDLELNLDNIPANEPVVPEEMNEPEANETEVNTRMNAQANMPVNPPMNMSRLNTPVNPPMNMSRLNMPVNQPVNTPVNQPVNTPVNQPVNTPVNPPMNMPVNQPVNTPVNPPANMPIDAMSTYSPLISSAQNTQTGLPLNNESFDQASIKTIQLNKN